jgi:hypothetical protein
VNQLAGCLQRPCRADQIAATDRQLGRGEVQVHGERAFGWRSHAGQGRDRLAPSTELV